MKYTCSLRKSTLPPNNLQSISIPLPTKQLLTYLPATILLGCMTKNSWVRPNLFVMTPFSCVPIFVFFSCYLTRNTLLQAPINELYAIIPIRFPPLRASCSISKAASSFLACPATSISALRSIYTMSQ